MDFHMGIEVANSIRHGERKEESMNLAETIKDLKKDV
jgi:predicted DNA-binding protein